MILAGTALASTGMGVAKTVKENKARKEAQDKIENYERQEIDFNNYIAALDYPTDQYVREMRLVQQQASNTAEAASAAGSRGMSLLPGIQESLYSAQEQVQANFQNQLYELQRQAAIMASQNEMREFEARENREQRELAGYGAMYEAGRQGMYSGLGDITQGVLALGGMASGWNLGGNNGVVSGVEAFEAPSVSDASGNNYSYQSGKGYVATGPLNLGGQTTKVNTGLKDLNFKYR